MDEMRKIKIVTAALLFVLLIGFEVKAETWHLDNTQQLQAVGSDEQSRYVLAVSELKQLAGSGKSKELIAKIKEFKKQFPGSVSEELDAFFAADIEYSKGHYTKAIRKYDAFLAKYPESQLREAVLEREFAIATAFLGGKKKPVLKIIWLKGYAEGEKIMDRISDRAGDSPIGIEAQLSVADSLEKRGKFMDAAEKWSEISLAWPMGKVGQESLLAMGRCNHASYRGPAYDGLSLISAKTYYENYSMRYTERAEHYQLSRRIAQIDEQMAYKQFQIAEYYKSSGYNQAANFYYQMVIDKWPQSTGGQMATTAIKEKNVAEEKTWKKQAVTKLKKLLL